MWRFDRGSGSCQSNNEQENWKQWGVWAVKKRGQLTCSVDKDCNKGEKLW